MSDHCLKICLEGMATELPSASASLLATTTDCHRLSLAMFIWKLMKVFGGINNKLVGFS